MIVCDKCRKNQLTYGEYRLENVLNFGYIYRDKFISHDEVYELCPECMKELKEWLKTEDNKDES